MERLKGNYYWVWQEKILEFKMEIIDFLIRPEVYGFLIPFLFVFMVMFGVLQIIKFFDRAINLVLAFGLSLMVINNRTLVCFLGIFAENIALIIFVLLALMIVLGLFLSKNQMFSKRFVGLGFVLSMILVVWSFRGEVCGVPGLVNIPIGLGEYLPLALFCLVGGILVWFVLREPKKVLKSKNKSKK